MTPPAVVADLAALIRAARLARMTLTALLAGPQPPPADDITTFSEYVIDVEGKSRALAAGLIDFGRGWSTPAERAAIQRAGNGAPI